MLHAPATLLPSLSRLVLDASKGHADELEPDDTRGAAAQGPSDVPRDFPRVENLSNYKAVLRNWKNGALMFSGRDVQGRWNKRDENTGNVSEVISGEYEKGAFFFDNNPKFIQHWVPIATHEGMCHKRNFDDGVGVMLPTQFVLRVVSDALFGDQGIPLAPLEEKIFVVDGSNMLEGSKRWKLEAFARGGKSEEKTNAIVICFVKTGTLTEDILSQTTDAKAKTEAFSEIQKALSLLTTNPDRIFLVVVDTWPKEVSQQGGRRNRIRQCKFWEGDQRQTTRDQYSSNEEKVFYDRNYNAKNPNTYSHLWCEFDDMLCQCMHLHLKAKGRKPAIVTMDGGIEEKTNEQTTHALLRYLEYNDTFLLRVFQPTQGFLNCISNIDGTYQERFTRRSDYILPKGDDSVGFPWGEATLTSMRANFWTRRTDDVDEAGLKPPSYAPGTWYTNQEAPLPPVWVRDDQWKEWSKGLSMEVVKSLAVATCNRWRTAAEEAATRAAAAAAAGAAAAAKKAAEEAAAKKAAEEAAARAAAEKAAEKAAARAAAAAASEGSGEDGSEEDDDDDDGLQNMARRAAMNMESQRRSAGK